MNQREDIRKVVFDAVDDFNSQGQGIHRLKKDLEARLYGGGGGLDSIGLVNFIVAVEEALADNLGVTVSLADEKAMSQTRSPFLTLGSFIDYIQKVLEA